MALNPYSLAGPYQMPEYGQQQPDMSAMVAALQQNQGANPNVPQGPESGYEADYSAVEYQKALAKALREKAGKSLETNRMAGGFVIPISPFEGLAKLGQGWMAGQAEKKASDKAAALESGQTNALAELLRSGKTPEEIYAAGASDPRLSGEYKKAFMMQGFASKTAEQKAKADAASDAAKYAEQEKRDAARFASQDQRDAARQAAQDARFAAQQAGLDSRLGRQLTAQAEMIDKRLAASEKKEDNKPKYGAKEMQTARDKKRLIDVARMQLKEVKKQRDNLLGVPNEKGEREGSAAAGYPGADYLPTEEGALFDSAISLMRNSITGLQRVPGVGSMAVYETQLDQSKFPSRGEREVAINNKVKGLEDYLDTLDSGYSDILGTDAPGGAAPAGGPQVGTVQDGFRFKGGNPADQNNWEPAQP